MPNERALIGVGGGVASLCDACVKLCSSDKCNLLYVRSVMGKKSGDNEHHRIKPSIGGIRAIGIEPGNKSSGGCASEHKVGSSEIHSVKRSINVSGGVAISPFISLKYKSDTDVMKFTANLRKEKSMIEQESNCAFK